MKRNLRITETKARALTNPTPNFVSLVKGGANQRPFRAVRMEGVKPSEPTQEDSDMTNVKLDDGHDIAALKFSGETFATEAAVKAWLDQGGYSAYEIETTKDGFTVTNTAVEFEEGTTQKVEGAVKGLTVYVGKLASPEATEKSDEEVTSEAATANPSSVQPLAPASQKAAEGAAKGEDTTKTEDTTKAEGETEAVAKAVAFVSKVKGLYENGTLTNVLVSLKWLIEDAAYTGAGDDVVAEVKSAAKLLLVALSKSTDEAIAGLEEAFKALIPVAAGDADNAAVTEKEAAVAEEPAPAPKSAEATEGEAVQPAAKGSDDLLAAIKGLTDAVSGLKNDLTEVKAEVATAKAEMNQRIEEVGNTSQTRKGADVSPSTEEAAATKKADTTDEDARKARRVRLASTLGHPDPSRV